MRRTFWLVVCALLACPAAVFAQRFDDVGVRAQGMAGAFVAVADDASANWWNPAGLAFGLNVVDVSAEVTEGGARGVSFAFPSLGLSYYRLKISQIQPSDSTGSTSTGRQDNGAAGSSLPSGNVEMSQFGATVGQSISDHLVIATTVKLVKAQSDTQADLDVGAMAQFGVLRLGVAVRDVRNPSFGSGTDLFEPGRRARAGAAVVMPARGVLDRLVLAVDVDLNASPVAGRDEQEVAGGVETWWLGRRVGVRGGGGRNTVAAGGSFGAFGVTVAPFQRLNIDGAITRGSDSVRNRWTCGLRLTF